MQIPAARGALLISLQHMFCLFVLFQPLLLQSDCMLLSFEFWLLDCQLLPSCRNLCSTQQWRGSSWSCTWWFLRAVLQAKRYCEREAYSDRGADECHPSTKYSGHSIFFRRRAQAKAQWSSISTDWISLFWYPTQTESTQIFQISKLHMTGRSSGIHVQCDCDSRDYAAAFRRLFTSVWTRPKQTQPKAVFTWSVSTRVEFDPGQISTRHVHKVNGAFTWRIALDPGWFQPSPQEENRTNVLLCVSRARFEQHCSSPCAKGYSRADFICNRGKRSHQDAFIWGFWNWRIYWI